MSEMQTFLSQHIGSLMMISFKITNPVSQLHMIREKIMVRGYQSFDKSDIIDELGRLQHIEGELHAEMLRIHDLLTKTNK